MRIKLFSLLYVVTGLMSVIILIIIMFANYATNTEKVLITLFRYSILSFVAVFYVENIVLVVRGFQGKDLSSPTNPFSKKIMVNKNNTAHSVFLAGHIAIVIILPIFLWNLLRL